MHWKQRYLLFLNFISSLAGETKQIDFPWQSSLYLLTIRIKFFIWRREEEKSRKTLSIAVLFSLHQFQVFIIDKVLLKNVMLEFMFY